MMSQSEKFTNQIHKKEEIVAAMVENKEEQPLEDSIKDEKTALGDRNLEVTSSMKQPKEKSKPIPVPLETLHRQQTLQELQTDLARKTDSITEKCVKKKRTSYSGKMKRESSGPKEIQSNWNLLPDLVLEEIYTYLTVQQRYRCSQVCKNWYSAFSYPKVWKRFTMTPSLFINHQSASNLHIVCHQKVEKCVAQVGQHIQFLEIIPSAFSFNIAEFLSVFSFALVLFKDFPLPNLKGFGLTYDCEIRKGCEVNIVGADSVLIKVIKLLFRKLGSLKYFKLNQILLDPCYASEFFINVATSSQKTMEEIEILNCTKTFCPLVILPLFFNLSRLTITSNHFSKTVIQLLLEKTKLRHLILVQDKYTHTIHAVQSSVWDDVKESYPELKVDLEYRGESESDVLIQPGAPVKKVIYRTRKSRIIPDTIISIIDNYRFSLCSYIHLQLPRLYSSRSFNERSDSTIVMMIRECPNLETLILNCKLSTCTVLVIAMEAKRLKTFCVRRNATLLRRDWTKCCYWSDDEYRWLMKSSRDYAVVEQEVGRLLGTQWGFLSDKQFKGLSAE